jgi:hypothetical protein
MTGFVDAFIVAAAVALIAAPHLKAGLRALLALVPAAEPDERRR